MGQPVAFFEIISPDAERARKFYAELFGWKVESDPAMGGYSLIDTQAGEGRRVETNILDLSMDARPCRRQHFVSARFIECAEGLPASRGQPQAMDKDNRCAFF